MLPATRSPPSTTRCRREARTSSRVAPVFSAIRSGRLGTRPRGRRPGPGRARRTCTPMPSRAARTVIAISAGRRTAGQRLAAPAAVREEGRVERERRRPRQPGEQPAAQRDVAEQADRQRDQVGAAGDQRRWRARAARAAAGRRRARTTRCRGRAGPRRAACRGGVVARGRGRRSTRSLCQPRMACPTRTVAKTRPTSRVGRPASAAATASPSAVSSAWRGWAARSSRTGPRSLPAQRVRGPRRRREPRAPASGFAVDPRLPWIRSERRCRRSSGLAVLAPALRDGHDRQYRPRGRAARGDSAVIGPGDPDGAGTGPPYEAAICQAQIVPLTCANAEGGHFRTC